MRIGRRIEGLSISTNCVYLKWAFMFFGDEFVRSKKLEVMVFNIHAENHVNFSYRKLLHFIRELEPAELNDDYRLVFGADHLSASSDTDMGDLIRYLHIGGEEPWYDRARNSRAGPERLAEINIPDNLYPKHSTFTYLFDYKTHKLAVQKYYDGSRISPRVVERALIFWLQHPKVVKKFGVINVTVVSSREAIDEFLKKGKLRRIRIEVKLPNPGDDTADSIQRIQAGLAKRNARRRVTELDAASADGLNLLQQDREEIEAAQTNGRVQGSRKEAGGPIETFDTKDHPFVRATRITTDSFLSSFQRAANAAIRELRSL